MDMKETIRELLRSLSGCGEFRDTDGLQDVLGLDSLAMVTLLVRLEDAFGIRLDESDMNPYELYAAQDVMRLVEKYLEKADGYPGRLYSRFTAPIIIRRRVWLWRLTILQSAIFSSTT